MQTSNNNLIKRLKCYNAFLTQYDNIDMLTEQVPYISDLGFNSLWLGPFWDTSNTKQKEEKKFSKLSTSLPEKLSMSRSIYAPKGDYSAIEKDFLSPEDQKLCVRDDIWRDVTKQKITSFTKACKNNGIVPISDLVLGHVHRYSELVPELTSQGLLSKKKNNEFQDVISYNYETEDPEVKKRLLYHWKKVVDLHMDTFGFGGFRIDNAASIPIWVRSELYKYIKDKNKDAIILDELLFSRASDYKKFIQDSIVDHKPTHVLNSVLWEMANSENNPRIATISKKLKYENGMKDLTVTGTGSTGSTGNHDFVNLTQGALESIFNTISDKEKFFKTDEKAKSALKMLDLYSLLPKEDRSKYKRFYLILGSYLTYSMCKVLDQNSELELDFLKEIKRRIAIACLGTTGGYVMLAGEERLKQQHINYIIPKPKKLDFIPKGDQSLNDFIKDIYPNLKPGKDREAKKESIRTLLLEQERDRDFVDNIKLDYAKSQILQFVKDINKTIDNSQDVSKGSWTEIIELKNGVLCFIEMPQFGIEKKILPEITLINLNANELTINAQHIKKIALKFEKQNQGFFGSGHYDLIINAFNEKKYRIVGDNLTMNNFKRQDTSDMEYANNILPLDQTAKPPSSGINYTLLSKKSWTQRSPEKDRSISQKY